VEGSSYAENQLDSFSRLSRTPTCDGRTDRHRPMAQHRAVKSHNRVFLIACFATDFRVYECVVFIDIVLFYDKISIRTVLRYCRVWNVTKCRPDDEETISPPVSNTSDGHANQYICTVFDLGHETDRQTDRQTGGSHYFLIPPWGECIELFIISASFAVICDTKALELCHGRFEIW